MLHRAIYDISVEQFAVSSKESVKTIKFAFSINRPLVRSTGCDYQLTLMIQNNVDSNIISEFGLHVKQKMN